MSKFDIRKAEKKDSALILDFIKELAEYEQLLEHSVGVLADIENTLFGIKPMAEVIIIQDAESPIGFALFFHNYSTFLCRDGIYIEDIYVREQYRGMKYGKALLDYICDIARQRHCKHVQLLCLKQNQSAIDFYLKSGAIPMSEWIGFHFDIHAIE